MEGTDFIIPVEEDSVTITPKAATNLFLALTRQSLRAAELIQDNEEGSEGMQKGLTLMESAANLRRIAWPCPQCEAGDPLCAACQGSGYKQPFIPGVSTKRLEFSDEPKPINESLRDFIDWAETTFPGETVDDQIKHFSEETTELAQSNFRDPEEFADAFMLLYIIAYNRGLDLFQCFREKLEVCKARTWEKTERGWRHGT